MEVVADPVSAVLRNKGPDLWSVTPQGTVYEAITLMAEKNIGALPVLEDGKLIGLISEREYARAVVLKGKASQSTGVREIMLTKVVHVAPNDNVGHCMQLMTDEKVRHLPVVDEGCVVGIVSIGDLVKWIISAQDALIHQLESYIQNAYPA